VTAYLLDTNHSITVLSELYFAACASRRQAQNLQNINHLLDHIPLLDFGALAAEEYGRIKAELKAKGRPIPGTDAQIAAVARLGDLTVLSADRHFQSVDNLRVESWL